MKARIVMALAFVLSVLTSVTARAWIIEAVDSAGGSGGFAVDSSGKAHISYYDFEGAVSHLRYATNTSGSWVTESLDSGFGVGQGSSIGVDNADKIHICYSGGLYDGLKYATNSSGAWVTESVCSGSPGWNGRSIAIDGSDKVHIGYVDGLDLKYATNVTDTWVTQTVDSTSTGVAALSIALDSSGKAHIGYIYGMPPDCTVSYATNASGSWGTETVESTAQPDYISIAVDGSSKAHICYNYGEVPDVDLKYATNASGSWVGTIVDSLQEFPGGGSIAMDGSDHVHLSYAYLDEATPSLHLKHAINTSGSWVATTVYKSGQDFVWSPLIALDNLDNVHIGYWDLMYYQVKYVSEECVPEECTNRVDDDCDGNIDDADSDCHGYSATANAAASAHGGSSLTASGSSNVLGLLLVPIGAVILLSFWRRKR